MGTGTPAAARQRWGQTLSDAVAPQPRLWTCLRIQVRVVGALILREMGTRFGRDNLGYVWLFLEPLMLGSAIGGLHLVTGHDMPGGLNPFVFWTVGYVPFYLFRGVVNRAATGIEGNQSLLYHRHITVLDIMLSRHLLEFCAVGIALCILLLLFGSIFGEWPKEPGLMVLGMVLMLGIAQGIAFLIAAGSVYTELFERITHLFTYLTMGFTGAFFMVFWLPTELQAAALVVPTVHCFELVRRGLYGTIVPTHFDIPYVIAWIAVLHLLGLAALRKARLHLVV
ncbi:ABC transporter permease [Paracraurococcus lichenis]|uniref:ABC transporter permease n=1 Tax=Paracraurococcus lichenis TaxID=3064888 RepID=A0ABT9DU11_9PROT|nr:ABC transporter permease [Paracraurococcus sp. LOR1-02]MDO9707387.1 ABC transporter permease [Paracraurococcus sp. LOR1-02]